MLSFFTLLDQLAWKLECDLKIYEQMKKTTDNILFDYWQGIAGVNRSGAIDFYQMFLGQSESTILYERIIKYNMMPWWDSSGVPYNYMYQGALRCHPSFLNFVMVAYFCRHLSDLYVDLQLFHLLENKSKTYKRVLAKLISYI